MCSAVVLTLSFLGIILIVIGAVGILLTNELRPLWIASLIVGAMLSAVISCYGMLRIAHKCFLERKPPCVSSPTGTGRPSSL